MVLRCATLMVVVMFIATSVAFGADALMGRCDPQQTSYTTEKLDPPLKLLWEYTANKYRSNSAAPLVAGNTAYFASGDRIYAVDAETGKWKWTYPSDQGLGGSVKGTPILSGGKLYVGAGDNNLYCLNAETGAYEWHYQTRGPIRCPLVIQDGIIIFGDDDNCLYAVRADNGDAAWSKPLQVKDDIAAGVAVGNGMAVAACMDACVYGVSLSTGKLRWIYRLGQAPTTTSPVMAENVVIMAIGNAMYGLSTRSGQLRWAVTLEAEAAATPAVDGTDIYVPCKNKKIYAYTATGRQVALKWASPADLNYLSGDTNNKKPKDVGGMPLSSPVVADKILYITGSRGVVAAYSTVDGSLKWRYAILPSSVTMPGSSSVDIACSPTVANGALWVLSDDGVLHCFTQTAIDGETPEIFNQTPANGIVMSGAPPIKFSACLYDVGSGVDFTSVSMTLDGNPVEYKVDLSTSTVTYTTETSSGGKPVRALSDGVHTVVLTAKDYAGNLLTNSWFFIADHTKAPPKSSPADVDWGTGKNSKEPPKKTLQRPTPPMMPGPPGGGPNGGPDAFSGPGGPDDGGGRHRRHNFDNNGDGGNDVPPPPAPGMP